jgi:hypothetical protein
MQTICFTTSRNIKQNGMNITYLDIASYLKDAFTSGIQQYANLLIGKELAYWYFLLKTKSYARWVIFASVPQVTRLLLSISMCSKLFFLEQHR